MLKADRLGAAAQDEKSKADGIDADNPRLLAAAADTPEHTEEMKNDQCPMCLTDFKEGESVAKRRCGHSMCLPCAADAAQAGILKCIICLRSETSREIQFEPEVDLSVFINPSAPMVKSDPGLSQAGGFIGLEGLRPRC